MTTPITFYQFLENATDRLALVCPYHDERHPESDPGSGMWYLGASSDNPKFWTVARVACTFCGIEFDLSISRGNDRVELLLEPVTEEEGGDR